MLIPYVYKEEKKHRLTLKGWGTWVVYALASCTFAFFIAQFSQNLHPDADGQLLGFWGSNQPMMFILVFAHDIQKVLVTYNWTPFFPIITIINLVFFYPATTKFNSVLDYESLYKAMDFVIYKPTFWLIVFLCVPVITFPFATYLTGKEFFRPSIAQVCRNIGLRQNPEEKR